MLAVVRIAIERNKPFDLRISNRTEQSKRTQRCRRPISCFPGVQQYRWFEYRRVLFPQFHRARPERNRVVWTNSTNQSSCKKFTSLSYRAPIDRNPQLSLEMTQPSAGAVCDVSGKFDLLFCAPYESKISPILFLTSSQVNRNYFSNAERTISVRIAYAINFIFHHNDQ